MSIRKTRATKVVAAVKEKSLSEAALHPLVCHVVVVVLDVVVVAHAAEAGVNLAIMQRRPPLMANASHVVSVDTE
jgi:hypothetical protein